MGDTTIEWTDKSWNPVTGCSKVSTGCKNCYAERIFHRPYPGRKFGDVRCHPERLEQPLHWKKPCRIFVNSMSDLFHEAIPDEFLWEIFGVMHRAQRHIFQVLTKRPERMRQALMAWEINLGFFVPRNIWLGVSAEDQPTFDARWSYLEKCPAALRFLSLEPLLGPIDIRRSLPHSKGGCGLVSVHWVIAGGESGPNARPSHPDWFRSVRDQCQAVDVPFFFKQWGEWQPLAQVHGGSGVHDSRVDPPKITVDGHLSTGETLVRVGKKRAGRLLDGREWNEFPGEAQACRNCGHGVAEHFGSDPECRRPDCPCDGYEAQA